MGTDRNTSIYRNFAVTIAFAFGSIAIFAVVRLLYLADVGALSSDAWLRVATSTFAFAVFSGLIADAIRYVGSFELHDKEMSTPSTSRALNGLNGKSL